MKKLLVIGKNWPEPNTTAAGYRMLQLLEVFQDDGYAVHFCSAAQKSNQSFDLENIGVTLHAILLNDDSFDSYVKELQPDVVMYDRFMIEEQYSWRVKDNSPSSLHILDTEDLHFLRKAREVAFRKKEKVNIFNETAMREIASIHRCDLSIIISSAEMELLEGKFKIPSTKLIYLPFLYNSLKTNQKKFPLRSFQERLHFVMIGNSLHEPNYDAILYLKKELWPQIRKQLPHVEVHIYGAYQTDKISQLHNKKEGFIIKGFAEDVHETLSMYKILLAPLRFGAGLKGKVFDALLSATPVAMTSIAAEGMFVNSVPFGFIEDDEEKYIKHCVELYQSPSLWKSISRENIKILENNFEYSAFAKALTLQISTIASKPKDQKSSLQKFELEMLNFHSNARSKYMSKWISLKNTK